MILNKFFAGLITLISVLYSSINTVHAQGESAPIFIRDAEIEHALRLYSTPIFKAAGLAPENINIFIIQDNTLNAFVAGGQNIFIHTGLITDSNDPLELIGVIAHETGHIAGGHLVRKNDIYEKATLGSALSYVLGAASVIAGSPKAGAAIISGGQHVANRNILQHSRVHEQSADQAALTFLDKTGYSARGLLDLLEKLGSRETLFYNELDPYTLTHPLSQERLSHIQNHLMSSGLENKKAPEDMQKIQKRIVAKIKAFLEDPKKVLEFYPEDDQTVPAVYARSIAYHRKADIASALEEIDRLLDEYPEDPYFNELKGQILFENGMVTESIPFYRKAVEIIPQSALFRIELASAQIAAEQKQFLPDAISTLEKALVIEPKSTMAWHQLGIAYGRNNQLGLSYIALAEEAALMGKKDESIKFTKLAEQHLEESDPAMLRAKDIRKYLEQKYPEEKLFQ